MRKIGKGTPRETKQFQKQRLVIYNIDDKSEQDVAGIIQNRIADFERTHDGYKFDKLIFDFDSKEKDRQFDLKFILKK